MYMNLCYYLESIFQRYLTFLETHILYINFICYSKFIIFINIIIILMYNAHLFNM